MKKKEKKKEKIRSEVSKQFAEIWDDLHDPVKCERRKLLKRREQYLENNLIDAGL